MSRERDFERRLEAGSGGAHWRALRTREVALYGLGQRYVDAVGPSVLCTGGASRGSPLPGVLLGALGLLLPLAAGPDAPRGAAGSGGLGRRPGGLLAAAALGVMAASLQGCDAVGKAAAAWEAKPSYLINFQFVPISQAAKQTGQWQLPASQAVLNSCEVADLPEAQRCGSHGVCKRFGAGAHDPLLFCECDRDWADPECRTPRKSQAAAFFLSLFAGPLGLDRFYLGEASLGVLKLASLGGVGIWWLYDVARIGSSPVYAKEYRLAADLPHWLYVFVAVHPRL